MSKPTKRKCPACQEMKEFRADQKTCGCKAERVVEEPSDREAFLRSKTQELTQQLTQVKREAGGVKELMGDLLAATKTLEPLKPVPHKSGSKAEAEMAAVIKFSDWHIGAVTKPDEVDGFGQFNWALAQERVQYIVSKVIGWVETHRLAFKIPKLYILSEGDMISGDIHYELQVTNEFPAPVQAVRAGALLAQAVATLAPHFPEVHLVEINIDNHSRLTKKLQFAQGAENSWQYVVHALANAHLKGHKNINIIEGKGIRELVNINGIKVLTEHGHTTKAWMGVPYYGIERLRGKEASKRIAAMLDQQRQHAQLQKDIGFDFMSMGHYHVAGWVSGNILMNGCLPGTTEFDHAMGRYAAPAQVSFLVHPKYKVYDFTPWQPKR